MSGSTPGISELGRVTLLPAQEQALDRLREQCLGPANWRARKLVEARELLALERIAPRMQILALEATTELRAIVALVAAVPTLPPGARDLVVEHEVHLFLRYPEQILRVPQPGYALVQILVPRHVHHANVGAVPSQPLCLGANVPRGYPLREALLASYAALTLQTATLDERDPAGVMNADAARWWQSNLQRIPLSATPFLAGVAGAGARESAP